MRRFHKLLSGLSAAVAAWAAAVAWCAQNSDRCSPGAASILNIVSDATAARHAEW